MHVYKRLRCGGEVLPLQMSMPSIDLDKSTAGTVDLANERKPLLKTSKKVQSNHQRPPTKSQSNHLTFPTEVYAHG